MCSGPRLFSYLGYLAPKMSSSETFAFLPSFFFNSGDFFPMWEKNTFFFFFKAGSIIHQDVWNNYLVFIGL